VTVSGATCLDADVAAKAAFLLGDEGPDWLDERGLPGRFLCPGDRAVTNRAWQRSLEGATVCT
jgi:thiamine biosynthesis lipoprotein ApbE